MMQALRTKAGKYVVIPIILTFVGWMVFELGMNVAGVGPGVRAGEMGRVNGEVVTAEAYNNALQQLIDRQRQSTGGEVTPEQRRLLEDQAWDQVVNEMLVRQALQGRRIRVTDAEILFASQNYPYPPLQSQDIFLTNGAFDIAKYRQFLAAPSTDPSLLREIEGYWRETIPQMKLGRQLGTGLYVTDAELWRGWQDRFETATVEYVSLDLTRLAPGDVTVSDAEIRAYYDDHKDRFERDEEAVVSVAYLPLTLTPEDTAATLQRARDLRAEIVAGADFAEVASRESRDPGSARQGGDLGQFPRGAFVAPFDSAVWTLPLNELSEPVVTQFGVHLIQVTAREDSTASARHILLEFEKSDEAMNALFAKADSLEQLSERSGLERAARLVGAVFRRGVTVTGEQPYIPGAGPAAEVLDWAANPSDDGTATANPVSGTFDNGESLYVVQLDRYRAKGTLPLAAATPEIRRELILEKKREIAAAEGAKIVAQVRGGMSLQQAAAARQLTVQTAGPFTRVEPNPALGQANAAIGAAFGTPIGQVSDVVRTPTGLFLIRPTSRTQADRAAFEAQKDAQRETTRAQMEQAVLRRWLESLRNDAEIVDNRAAVARAIAAQQS